MRQYADICFSVSVHAYVPSNRPLQIAGRKMRLALVIQIHEHVARASALLARETKDCPDSTQSDPRAAPDTACGYVQTSQSARRDPVPHRSDAPSQPIRYKMTVGQKCAVFSNRNLLLAVRWEKNHYFPAPYRPRSPGSAPYTTT